VALRLARWPMPISLHYGDRDSQTLAERQIMAARRHVPADRLRVAIHRGYGHSLAPNALYGPLDETLADALADEAAGVTCPQ
jgi:hypothetical protein